MMGETLKCQDCSHYFEHTGCIHTDGTGVIATCPHFDSWVGDETADMLFPECSQGHKDPTH
jgi:hypothetical protein